MKRLILLLLLSCFLLLFGFKTHHYYMAGVNIFIQPSAFFIFAVIAFLAIWKLFPRTEKMITTTIDEEILDDITKVKRSKKLVPNDYFIIASLIYFALSFFAYIFSGNSGIDLQFHDTYFVLSQYHLLISLAISFAIIGFSYKTFNQFYESNMNHSIGKIHFFICLLVSLPITIITVYLFSSSTLLLTRRNPGYLMNDLKLLLTILAFIFPIAFFLPLVVNFIYSLRSNNKSSSENKHL